MASFTDKLSDKLSPGIVNMIRADHAAVLATFHKFDIDTPPKTKQALVNTACVALEIHAQLEEEIFYPAMRAVAGGNEVLAESVPAHDAMRESIASLRAMQPGDLEYDRTFMKLVRDVMHHMADEESVLLPQAESLLADQLSELGMQMTKRRLQLSAPRAGEIIYNAARGRPVATALVAAGALLAGALLAKNASARQSR